MDLNKETRTVQRKYDRYSRYYDLIEQRIEKMEV